MIVNSIHSIKNSKISGGTYILNETYDKTIYPHRTSTFVENLYEIFGFEPENYLDYAQFALVVKYRFATFKCQNEFYYKIILDSEKKPHWIEEQPQEYIKNFDTYEDWDN